MKKLVGIFCVVLVIVESCIFPFDVSILDDEVDFKIPIILERTIIKTLWELVDIETR